MRTSKQTASPAPSLLATTLAGATPTVRPGAAQGATRLHLLKDSGTVKGASKQPARAGQTSGTVRDFNAADRSIIRRVHGYMSAAQLLNILNERLACDQGEGAQPFTLDQLRAEIASLTGGATPGSGDWASLRRVLAKAQRDGVLDGIDEQVIDDFAVVFSLNQKQVMVLKDIVLQAKEG